MEQKYCKICGTKISNTHNSIYCKTCSAYSEGKICKKCGKPIGNTNKTGYCEKCVKYKEDKHCIHCGTPITDKNKIGYCMKCRPKYYAVGENNPFYGKKHSQEVIDKMKIKCKIASENLWKNEDYRKRNIESTTGLKRSEEFKNSQRIHALKQFQDPKQREIRSKRMKRSWQEGTIVYTPNISINSSKAEKDFIMLLNEELKNIKIQIEQKHVIRYKNKETNRKCHLFPDGFINEKNIVIEFHGSFWHADKRYFPDGESIIHHGVKAKEIWEMDRKKEELYKKLGYNYIVVWSEDFKKNKEEILKSVLEKIKNI